MHRLPVVWSILAAIALAIHLGGYPLLEPDEGRNGEVGREMAATNDYVLPHIDGLPYLDKPVVYFAAEAAAMEVLGPTELAARLPAFLFTLLTAVLIAWWAGRIGIDPYVTVIAFLAMPLTMAFARTVIFDSALSFFIAAAIIAFYEERPTLAWAAIGFGVITKGPVAIALPLLVAIPYAIWRKRFRTIWSWGGLALFVIVVAPWVYGVSLAVPDFLRYVLVTETAQRLTTGALKRTGPPWYFIPYLIGGAFPWSIAAFFGDRRPATGDRWRDRYLLLWIAVPFIFFSLSQSKRPQYILPLMPAIALYVASRWNERMAKAAAITVAIFGALIAIAAPRVHLRAEFAAPAREAAVIIGICAVVAGVIALWRLDFAVIALSVPILIIPLATNSVMQSLAFRRSQKALALAIRPHLTPATQLIGERAFTGSMAFYLQRPIVVVSPDGEEFTSNYITRHYSAFVNRSNLRNQPVYRPGDVVIVRANAPFDASSATRIAEDGHYAAYTIRR